jgi:hypothetical protein
MRPQDKRRISAVRKANGDWATFRKLAGLANTEAASAVDAKPNPSGLPYRILKDPVAGTFVVQRKKILASGKEKWVEVVVKCGGEAMACTTMQMAVSIAKADAEAIRAAEMEVVEVLSL